MLDTRVEDQDEHWAPAYHFCSVCMINYDVIVKFEQLETEERELKRYLGAENELKEESKMNAYSQEDSSYSPELLTEIYFATLTSEDKEGLARLYANDFRMFGYDDD